MVNFKHFPMLNVYLPNGDFSDSTIAKPIKKQVENNWIMKNKFDQTIEYSPLQVYFSLIFSWNIIFIKF